MMQLLRRARTSAGRTPPGLRLSRSTFAPPRGGRRTGRACRRLVSLCHPRVAGHAILAARLQHRRGRSSSTPRPLFCRNRVQQQCHQHCHCPVYCDVKRLNWPRFLQSTVRPLLPFYFAGACVAGTSPCSHKPECFVTFVVSCSGRGQEVSKESGRSRTCSEDIFYNTASN